MACSRVTFTFTITLLITTILDFQVLCYYVIVLRLKDDTVCTNKA
jgi:hypothetical protein